MIRVNVLFFFILFCAWNTSCTSQNNPPILIETPNVLPDDKKERKSILQEMKEHRHLSVEQRISLYYRLKREQFHLYNFDVEDDMNMYGYTLLWSNRVTDAIEIFKLLVSEFPNSSNTYDSLGEAYLANGNKELSLINYSKSLELDPSNFHAEDQIYRIKHPTWRPETPAEKFAKTYAQSSYMEDFDQLGNTLREMHPNTHKFISSEDFTKIIETKKALISDSTTYAEFAWHCSEIIASVNCSHSSMGGFFHENEMLPASLRFPLQVRWVNDQLFVIDALSNADNVEIKDEIIRVNGVLVHHLIRDIYKHIASQGFIETTKKNFFNTWATILIPYALGFPESYEIEIAGKGSMQLNTTVTGRNQFDDPSIKTCQDGLCFEIDDDNLTAILTISTFNYYAWNNLSDFQHFMDNSFKIIHEKGIENLVIDLRFNGGGSPESSIYLLRYLVDKPFVYYSSSDYKRAEGKTPQYRFENAFDGNCYFIIDGNGKSTTGHFMSLVKVFNLGTIIGEELGSNQFCSAGQRKYRLKHTKLEFYVASNSNETTATELPDEQGIMPHHFVTQDIDAYLNKQDTVMQYTFRLIQP